MSLSAERLRETIEKNRELMLRLLCDSVGISSLSGQEKPFVQFICDWAKQQGFETDLWETDEAALSQYPKISQPHIPLAGRPTLVIRLRGNEKGRSLIFNAHADVVAPGEEKNWTIQPWSGEFRGGRVYGRGSCDAKGPLIAALWAMLAIRNPRQQAGDILLELVPGEENCVGLGTLTSIARGYRADGAIVLEPSENLPRCASRAGLRFEITCRGKSIHGTAKWQGSDAIEKMREVLDAIDFLEQRWDDRGSEVLFADYPIARPVTVDFIHGGQWRGIVCESCTCAGYLELLPGDDNDEWKKRFADAVCEEAGHDGIDVSFGEEYEGYQTSPDSPFCAAAESIVRQSGTLKWNGWSGFNSGCEAGVRAKMHGTPTLVWGSGNLAQAHAANEFISFHDVETFAKLSALFAVNWTSLTKEYK